MSSAFMSFWMSYLFLHDFLHEVSVSKELVKYILWNYEIQCVVCFYISHYINLLEQTVSNKLINK